MRISEIILAPSIYSGISRNSFSLLFNSVGASGRQQGLLCKAKQDAKAGHCSHDAADVHLYNSILCSFSMPRCLSSTLFFLLYCVSCLLELPRPFLLPTATRVLLPFVKSKEDCYQVEIHSCSFAPRPQPKQHYKWGRRKRDLHLLVAGTGASIRCQLFWNTKQESRQEVSLP